MKNKRINLYFKRGKKETICEDENKINSTSSHIF